MALRVAITGTRSWVKAAPFAVLLADQLGKLGSDDGVILGDAQGIDSLAHFLCVELHIFHVVEIAHWGKQGNAAGPIRNGRMLDHKPDELWWFHPSLSASKGTKNMVAQARGRGILTRGWGSE